MSVEANKTLVRRRIEERNKGKTAFIAAIDELYATDFVDHYGSGEVIQFNGLKDFKQRVNERSDYLDQHSTIEDMIAEGDKVVVRWTWSGTHKATNKKLTGWGISIYRIAGGKIAERWERMDTLGSAQQLGRVPTPQTET